MELILQMVRGSPLSASPPTLTPAAGDSRRAASLVHAGSAQQLGAEFDGTNAQDEHDRAWSRRARGCSSRPLRAHVWQAHLSDVTARGHRRLARGDEPRDGRQRARACLQCCPCVSCEDCAGKCAAGSRVSLVLMLRAVDRQHRTLAVRGGGARREAMAAPLCPGRERVRRASPLQRTPLRVWAACRARSYSPRRPRCRTGRARSSGAARSPSTSSCAARTWLRTHCRARSGSPRSHIGCRSTPP
jgi:hypothetical protein